MERQSSPDAVPLSLGAEDFAKSLTCMLLAGPLLTGYTQTINDWYDRDIDAINEPYRPIPSGRITEPQVGSPLTLLFLKPSACRESVVLIESDFAFSVLLRHR